MFTPCIRCTSGLRQIQRSSKTRPSHTIHGPKKDAIDFFPRFMLDYDSPGLKLLSSIRSTGSEEKQRKTNWTAEVMAAYILQLHILYVEAFFSTVGKPF